MPYSKDDSVRRLLGATIAVVPFGCLFICDQSLRNEGWPVWRSPVYVGCFVSLLIGAWFWARHFMCGRPLLRTCFSFLVLALIWIVVRTDWIVQTDYAFMNYRGLQTYTPPTSPLWHPPRPQDLSPTATSWQHWDFFYMGGGGGPTEKPHLRINWPIAALKIALITIPGYLLAVLLTSISNRFPRKPAA